MIMTLLPAAIVGTIVAILGLRWAKQEREESRAHVRDLNERIKARSR
jgi:mannose/fructose/N-acetylgalactosamine-specific phosphotransferase system component IIC